MSKPVDIGAKGYWLVYGSRTGRSSYHVLSDSGFLPFSPVVSHLIAREFATAADRRFSAPFEEYWQFFELRVSDVSVCLLTRTSWVAGGGRGEDFVVWALLLPQAALETLELDFRLVVQAFPPPGKPEENAAIDPLNLARYCLTETRQEHEDEAVLRAVVLLIHRGTHCVFGGVDARRRLDFVTSILNLLPRTDRAACSFSTITLQTQSSFKVELVSDPLQEAFPQISKEELALVRAWSRLRAQSPRFADIDIPLLGAIKNKLPWRDVLTEIYSAAGVTIDEVPALLEIASREPDSAYGAVLAECARRIFEAKLPHDKTTALEHIARLEEKGPSSAVLPLYIPRLIVQHDLLSAASISLIEKLAPKLVGNFTLQLSDALDKSEHLSGATLNALLVEWQHLRADSSHDSASVTTLRNALLNASEAVPDDCENVWRDNFRVAACDALDREEDAGIRDALENSAARRNAVSFLCDREHLVRIAYKLRSALPTNDWVTLANSSDFAPAHTRWCQQVLRDVRTDGWTDQALREAIHLCTCRSPAESTT